MSCADCKYIKRTSPEQVFLRCDFWASKPLPVADVKTAGYGYDYIVLHCHVQPEAPACPMFVPREVSDAA